MPWWWGDYDSEQRAVAEAKLAAERANHRVSYRFFSNNFTLSVASLIGEREREVKNTRFSNSREF